MSTFVIRGLLAFGLFVGEAAARDASSASSEGERDIRPMKQADEANPQIEGEAQLLQTLGATPPASHGRMRVLQTLADAGVQSEMAQAALLEFIYQDAGARDRFVAIHYLKKFNVPAQEAVPALIAALDDHRDYSGRGCSDGRVSYAAIVVLAHYGPDAKAAIPALEWGIHPANDRPLDREAAYAALGSIDPARFPFFAHGEAAIEPLITELTSEVPDRRRQAAMRLCEFHEWATPAIPHFEKTLSDEQLKVRAAAAVALLAMAQNARAVEVLEDYAHSPDVFDRQRLVRWLENDLHFDNTKLLLELLKDEDPFSRSQAAIRLLSTDRKQQEVIEAMIDLFRQGSYEGAAYALKVFRSLDAASLQPAKELIVEASQGKYATSVRNDAERLLAEKFPEAFRDNRKTTTIPSLPEQFSSIEAMEQFATAKGDAECQIERLSNGTSQVWSLRRSFPSSRLVADHTIYAARDGQFVRLASIPTSPHYELGLSEDGKSIEFLEEKAGYPKELPVFSVELYPQTEAPSD